MPDVFGRMNDIGAQHNFGLVDLIPLTCRIVFNIQRAKPHKGIAITKTGLTVCGETG